MAHKAQQRRRQPCTLGELTRPWASTPAAQHALQCAEAVVLGRALERGMAHEAAAGARAPHDNRCPARLAGRELGGQPHGELCAPRATHQLGPLTQRAKRVLKPSRRRVGRC
eukprot:4697537-Prymnesium_polylepis.1